MFWRKKTGDKVERGERPPVDDVGRFMEWLLRYGEDFDIYRQTLRGSVNSFVAAYVPAARQELEAYADLDSLTRRVGECCAQYAQDYQKLVETAGGLQNLPSHMHDKVFPLLVRLRLLMHVRFGRYAVEPTQEMLAAVGPLRQG